MSELEHVLNRKLNNSCITPEHLGFLTDLLSADLSPVSSQTFMCCILIFVPAKRLYLFYLFMYTAIDKQCSTLAITSSEGIHYLYIKILAMIECLKNDKHKCKKQILINGRYVSVHTFTLQRLICKILSLEEI